MNRCFCMAVAVVASCCGACFALTEVVDGITYTFTIVEGGAKIYEEYGCAVSPKPRGNLVVPAKLGGLDVVAIGNSAFEACAELEEVTLPSSVCEVGSFAFYSCQNLECVHLPIGLKSIASDLFHGCVSLRSIELPEGIENIGARAFYGCTLLRSFGAWKNVKQIGDYAFYKCKNFSMSLPGGLVSIGTSAFQGSKISSVVIPQSVTSIGGNAFVETPFWNAFTSEIIVQDSCLLGSRDWGGVVFVPSGVRLIADSAFEKCKNLTAVILPDSVEIIGKAAFYACSNLKSCNWPENIKEIGNSAFNYCEKLDVEPLPTSIDYVGANAFCYTAFWNRQADELIVAGNCFLGCQNNVRDVIIPNGIKCVSGWSTGGGNYGYSVHIPEGVKSISDFAFDMYRFSYVYVPDSVERIGEAIFMNCSNLRRVSTPWHLIEAMKTDVVQSMNRTLSGLRPRNWAIEVIGRLPADELGDLVRMPDGISKFDGMSDVIYDGKGHTINVAALEGLTIDGDAPQFSYSLTSNGVYRREPYYFTNACVTSMWYKISAANYEDYVHEARVTILPREVTLTSGSATKYYDGDPLVCDEMVVGGDEFVDKEGVLPTYAGSQTAVGVSDNEFSYVFIPGTDADNYSIKKKYGKLEVLPLKKMFQDGEPGTVTKPVGGISKFDGEAVKYDGEGHAINIAALEAVTLVADTPSFSYSLTSNGVYRSEPYYFTNACVTSFWYKISAANYEDYVHEARVTILSREVTLTSGSASKNFDGTALRCERVEVTGDGFVTGEGVDVVYTGSQLWPRSSENTFTYSFRQGTLESNYDVTTANGTLTVGAAGRVVVDASVTAIPAEAFKNYTELTEVVLPDALTEIGADAFAGCTKLAKVAFPSGMEVTREKLRGWGLSDAVLDDYVEGDFVIVNTSLLGYVGAADVAELVISDGIELIDEYALSELDDLERVELPETVKYIGKGAFANDTYLDEVVLPDSVEVIGEGAFADCSWMQTMTMGAAVRSVGDRAFAGCTKLAAAKFADGLGEVGDAAFSNCWRMMSVSLPVSVSNVAATAFKDCASLTGVTVPTGYGRAGARPSQTGTMAEWFAPVYRQIENVTVPEGTTEVCAEMFAGCASLKTVELPEGVTNIASGAFRDCVALETILLPESLEAIGDESFAGCAALKAIVLPKNVAVLGKRVFSGCAALADVTLSRALMAIPDGTFAGCDALDSFVVPEAVTTLGSQIVPSATTAIYYLGNAPSYAADVYAQANASLVSYVVEGTKGWDGRPASRDIPRNWPTTNARAITTWPPVKIDVTFVGNGGAFENPAGESCVCKQIVDTAYSLPPYEPVRKGYRFDGYWTEANGGTRVTSGAAVKLTKDHSLYAHWKEYDTPTIEGDEGATVTGDVETGFVIKSSEGKTVVEVTIPPGVDVAKVTVEVTPKVATVKPNGAKVKVVVGENDISGFLVIPESEGVLNLAAATVKEEIVKETLDPSKDAVIELNAANPRLTTAPTRKGLTYTLYEGRRLESLLMGDSKLGDGDPWKPTITVSGGDAAFYSIDVSK